MTLAELVVGGALAVALLAGTSATLASGLRAERQVTQAALDGARVRDAVMVAGRLLAARAPGSDVEVLDDGISIRRAVAAGQVCRAAGDTTVLLAERAVREPVPRDELRWWSGDSWRSVPITAAALTMCGAQRAWRLVVSGTAPGAGADGVVAERVVLQAGSDALLLLGPAQPVAQPVAGPFGSGTVALRLVDADGRALGPGPAPAGAALVVETGRHGAVRPLAAAGDW